MVEIAPDRVRLKTGDEVRDLPNDYVFVFAGGEPPFDFLKACGVRFGGEQATPQANPGSALVPLNPVSYQKV